MSETANRKLTACHSGSRLPSCNLEGIIKGPDSHTHTKGLSAGVGKRSTGELDVLAFEGPNTARLRKTKHSFKKKKK